MKNSYTLEEIGRAFATLNGVFSPEVVLRMFNIVAGQLIITELNKQEVDQHHPLLEEE